jgi:glycosyltransferase involved in cell wall biosynthesis
LESDLKLGIVTSFLGNLRAGTWTYTWNLLKGISLHTGVVALDREERVLPGLEEVALNAYTDRVCALSKLYWPNVTLPAHAAADRFDLVHCTTPYGTFRKTGYRNIITVCDVTPLLFPEAHGRMNVWHHRYALPAILGRADRIVTISEASKLDIIRHYRVSEKKISVTLLAADEKFCPIPAGTPSPAIHDLPRPYILNVGTLEPRKNLAGLVRAFAAARSKGMLHTLIISGAPGWGRSPLADLIQELALDDVVIFTGFVEDDDLPHLYAGADFFVYPSLYEGFGLPVLEAMACGTPVITSNVSSLPEVAGAAALLIDPCSTAELSGAMLRLAGDETIRRQLSIKGLERAGHFSWEQTSEQTWQIYHEVIGNRQ